MTAATFYTILRSYLQQVNNLCVCTVLGDLHASTCTIMHSLLYVFWQPKKSVYISIVSFDPFPCRLHANTVRWKYSHTYCLVILLLLDDLTSKIYYYLLKHSRFSWHYRKHALDAFKFPHSALYCGDMMTKLYLCPMLTLHALQSYFDIKILCCMHLISVISHAFLNQPFDLQKPSPSIKINTKLHVYLQSLIWLEMTCCFPTSPNKTLTVLNAVN